MDFTFFLKGLILGFAIAAPVGPIGVLCIQRTLNKGRLNGFISGLGAATADAFYGAIAGFGLTFLSNLLLGSIFWLRLFGGIFLLYLGIRTIVTKPVDTQKSSDNLELMNAYSSTLFLTLTNPTTVFSFLAVFAGFGLVGTASNYLSASSFVLGVFLGSAFWWLILSTLMDYMKSKFNISLILKINILSGILILSFGLVALVSLYR